MEYYDIKGYSNREEVDQDEELEEEDKNYNIINTTNNYLLSPSCYNNYGSSSSPSPSPQIAEAINFMDLSLTNQKDVNNDNNEWPPDNEREHMFDKVVTPSDVGKLNRLVIPKQHAEKYFPLDSSTNEKGLLLNFVDRAGKPWRFRYSYWNSSQSYVMTKGWSRFVKDKKLDAGDIVSFQRSVKDTNALYIDWRRRPPPPLPSNFNQAYPTFWGTGGGGGRFYLPSITMPFRHHHENFHYNIPHPYHHHHHHHNPYQFQHASAYQLQPYYSNGSGISSLQSNMVIDSVPVVPRQQVVKAMSPASKKRLRLFGVNMECSSSSSTMQENDDEEGNQILASTVALLSPRQLQPAVELRLLPDNYGGPVVVAGADDQVSEKGKSTSLSFYLDP